MTTAQLIALAGAVLAIAGAALALTVDRVLTRRRAHTITTDPRAWVFDVGRTGIQCPLPECGKPVDVMRGHGNGGLVALTPCGHAVPRELLHADDDVLQVAMLQSAWDRQQPRNVVLPLED